MPITCLKSRTIFYPAPKNANSSLSQTFFELDNDRPYVPMIVNGEKLSLFSLYKNHQTFRPVQAPDGFDKITIVRDPLKRFISFYVWGVIKGRCPLPGVCDINQLVETLEQHLEANEKARFHLTPQHVFIGNSLAYFDRVFEMEKMAAIYEYLSARAGQTVAQKTVNMTRSGEADVQLSPASMTKLHAIYAADFALLKDIYS